VIPCLINGLLLSPTFEKFVKVFAGKRGIKHRLGSETAFLGHPGVSFFVRFSEKAIRWAKIAGGHFKAVWIL